MASFDGLVFLPVKEVLGMGRWMGEGSVGEETLSLRWRIGLGGDRGFRGNTCVIGWETSVPMWA